MRELIAQAEALTVDRLKELLNYSPETGVFTWRARTAKCVTVGNVAGSKNKRGYCYISVEGSPYRAHRLAWFYVHGVWPAHQIDHINGVRDDNRIANLREVSGRFNTENQRRAQSRNKLGLLGVSPKNNRFAARIMTGYKCIHLGYFATAEEAHAAYLNAKRQLHEGCTL